MELPAAARQEFLSLVSGTGHDDHAIGSAIDTLAAAVHAAVPSYRGLRVTIMTCGEPSHLDVFTTPDTGEQITTSLRLAIAALVPAFPADSRIVFYATTPGAFVDLVADLQYVLRPSFPSDDDTQSRADTDPVARLDIDVPTAPSQSGLTGFDTISTINRAIGILIGQGHAPDDALATLQQRAATAGVTPTVWAARLLRR